jgi:hypothetical protein
MTLDVVANKKPQQVHQRRPGLPRREVLRRLVRLDVTIAVTQAGDVLTCDTNGTTALVLPGRQSATQISSVLEQLGIARRDFDEMR